MIIEQQVIKVRDVVDGYEDNGNDGVVGYHGKLDIRPAFQREFIYNSKQRNAVIESMLKDFPLNVMYWVKRGEQFEVLDGQQRTISICSFVIEDYSMPIAGNDMYFHGLSEERQTTILDYELTVYFCEGTDDETMEWFRIVNIAGEVLREQELLNAIYGGPWIESAKKYFSRPGSPAYHVGGKYLSGSSIRQDYLETAIKWKSQGDIKPYLAEHQNNSSAVDLWNYFRSVIEWVEAVFPKYRTSMKGRDWGRMYDKHKDRDLSPEELEEQVAELIKDDDVTSKQGIYEYVLTGNDHLLNIRQFSVAQKEAKYEEQKGICAICGNEFAIDEMEGDHITPWSEGGATVPENLQMVSRECNRRKGKK